MPTLTFEQLRDAVAGEAVALRSRLTLQPAGGPGTKVAPPTYGVADNAEHKYATEKRVRADGAVSDTVLLNSVAAQANAMEEALLEGWDLEELDFPVAYVDFEGVDDLADLGSSRIMLAQLCKHHRGFVGSDHDHHPESHVEDGVGLVEVDVAVLQQPIKNCRPRQSRSVDPRRGSRRPHTRHVVDQTTTGDVCQSVHNTAFDQRHQRR